MRCQKPTLPYSYDFGKIPRNSPPQISRPATEVYGLSARKQERANLVGVAPPVQYSKRVAEDGKFNRTAYYQPSILPRRVPGLDMPGDKGLKLSDETLGQLLSVDVPDKNDIQWTTEYQRRLLAGETVEQLAINPPLGRKQRVKKERLTIGKAAMNNETRINAIKTAIDAGFSKSFADRAALGVEIVKLFSSLSAIESLTNANMAVIVNALKSIKMPKTWTSAGLPMRLYNAADFAANSGEVIAFTLANLPSGVDINLPIIGLRGTPVSLGRLFKLATGNAEFDVENRQIISKAAADAIRAASGAISVAKPEEKKEVGIPFITEDFAKSQGKTPNEVLDEYIGTFTYEDLINDYATIGLPPPPDLLAIINVKEKISIV